MLRTARPRAEQNPFAECHRSGGDLNCARQQNGNEGCRMENGRQLKIQSELARERRSEGGIEGVGTERARRGIGVNVTRAGKRGKKTERDRLSAEFYNGPRDHSALTPPRKIMANGCACCSIFEFATIRAVLFVRFSSPPPACLSRRVRSSSPRTRAKRKRASENRVTLG